MAPTRQFGQATRLPAVAGSFYPADPAALQKLLRQCFDQARPTDPDLRPAALIAPHAGLVYSGPIAATAWRTLTPAADRIRRVVLAGPSHRVAFRGVALSGAERFATPLGDIEVDTGAVQKLAGMADVLVLDQAHAAEHCLEVHLPFLQTVLQQPLLIPLVVGHDSAAIARRVLEQLWDDAETAIVISSDLSHYHPYAAAKQLDADTTAMIERFDEGALHPERACGCEPVRALLQVGRSRNLHAHTLDVRNSGDTSGDRSAVVGYGAWAFD